MAGTGRARWEVGDPLLSAHIARGTFAVARARAPRDAALDARAFSLLLCQVARAAGGGAALADAEVQAPGGADDAPAAELSDAVKVRTKPAARATHPGGGLDRGVAHAVQPAAYACRARPARPARPGAGLTLGSRPAGCARCSRAWWTPSSRRASPTSPRCSTPQRGARRAARPGPPTSRGRSSCWCTLGFSSTRRPRRSRTLPSRGPRAGGARGSTTWRRYRRSSHAAASGSARRGCWRGGWAF